MNKLLIIITTALLLLFTNGGQVQGAIGFPHETDCQVEEANPDPFSSEKFKRFKFRKKAWKKRGKSMKKAMKKRFRKGPFNFIKKRIFRGMIRLYTDTWYPQAEGEQLVSYELDNKSAFLQLEAIQREACAAGVKFDYSVIEIRNKVKRLNINMGLQGEGTTSHILLKGKFDITVGWVVNAEGEAVRIYNKGK